MSRNQGDIPLQDGEARNRDALVKAALAAAWQRALERIPQLALLGADGGSMKARMAFIIDEAASHGLANLDMLVALALDVLPKRGNRP